MSAAARYSYGSAGSGGGGGGEQQQHEYNEDTPTSSVDDGHEHAASAAAAAAATSSAVARVAKACVPCSTKKRRCDGGKPECKVCLVLGTPCKYEARGLKRGPPKGFRAGPKESARAKLLRTLETTIRDLTLHIGRHDACSEIVRVSAERGIDIAQPDLKLSSGEAKTATDLRTTMKRVKRELSAPPGGTSDDIVSDESDDDMLGISEQGAVRHIGSSSGIQLLQQHHHHHHHHHGTAAPTLSPKHYRSGSAASASDMPSRVRSSPRTNQPPIPLPSATPRMVHRHSGSSPSSHSGPSPYAGSSSAAGLSHVPTIASPHEERRVSLEMNRTLFWHYWNGFHHIWPILYKPALDDISVDMLPSALDTALVNAIYALAVCVADASLDTAELEAELGEGPAGEVFARRAEHYLFLHRNAPAPSLASIHCCFLLSCYHQGAGHLSKAYLFSSLANSMAIDLGLHRHLHHYEHDLIERESRSRLIHCIYILSTILSAEMGRPPMLRSKDIDVPPLGEDEADEMEVDSMGRQRHSASLLNNSRRLFAIVETVLTQVHSFRRKAALRRKGSEGIRHVVEEIDQSLEEWRQSLPDYLRLPQDVKNDDGRQLEPVPSFAAVQVWYYVAKLLLHRPFIPQDEGLSLSDVLQDKYHQKCTQASQSLYDLLLQLARSSNVDRLSTDLAYIIFTAAVMFVFNARLSFHAGAPTSQSSAAAATTVTARRTAAQVERLSSDAKRQFSMCKDWLKRLSERWPSASAHRQLLDGFSVVGEGVVGGEAHSFTGRRPSLANGGGLIPAEYGQMQPVQETSWPAPSYGGFASAPAYDDNGAYDAASVTSGSTHVLGGEPVRPSTQETSYSQNAPVPFTTYAQQQEQQSQMGAIGPDGISSAAAPPPQQSLNAYFEFAPNIFDMENVYWNETATRMTPFFGPRDANGGGNGAGSSTPAQASYGNSNTAASSMAPPLTNANANYAPMTYTPRTLGALNAVANYAGLSANLGPPQLPAALQQAPPMGPPVSSSSTSVRPRSAATTSSSTTADAHSSSPGLQILAHAVTTSTPIQGGSGGSGSNPHYSPFSFHQETSAPEWGDVISMLQLPPAFIQ